MKVQVRVDRDGASLTYEAPEGTPVGARVRLPLPYFLDTSSGRLDYPNGMKGTVTGPGTYVGQCVRILGLDTSSGKE